VRDSVVIASVSYPLLLVGIGCELLYLTPYVFHRYYGGSACLGSAFGPSHHGLDRSDPLSLYRADPLGIGYGFGAGLGRTSPRAYASAAI